MISIVGLGRALVDGYTDNERIIPVLESLIGHIEQGHKHFLLDDEQARRILSHFKIEDFVAGGSVANTLRCLSKNGKTSTFVGTVGNDELADVFLSELQSDGVQTQVQRLDGITGFTVFCEFPEIGSKTCLFYYGASDTPFSVGPTVDLLDSDTILYSSAYNFVPPTDKSIGDVYLKVQERKKENHLDM